jgi:hypothetical protein
MQKTWMPMTAGILEIIAGGFGLIAGLVLFIIGAVGSKLMAYYVPDIPPATLVVIFISIAVPLIVIAVLAIVGGIYALRRKIWGLALAGSIAAFFIPSSWLLGIAAIVFTALSKNEFE